MAGRHKSRGSWTCDACGGKRVYLSRKDARYAAKQANPADPGNAYLCPENPEWWHIGHLPGWVKNGSGEVDR
jgi:hypothetical protein